MNLERTPKRWPVLLAIITIAALAVSPLFAANIYEEPFDYGASDLPFNGGSVGTWTSTSGVLKYDADGGLDHAQMGGEAGGAMWLDYTAARTGNDSSLAYALSNLGAGQAVWLAVVLQYMNGTGTGHSLSIAGGAVSALGITITSAGDVTVYCSDNGAGAATRATGISGVGSGTYLLLLRATKGAGTSPTASTVDFWFDPANASSEANLGSPDWTTGPDSKFGRDTDSFSQVTATPSEQGRIDEIRIGTVFEEVMANAPPTPPEISALSPTNTATGVSVATDLVMTFNESIATNSGNVVITNITDAASVTIPMGNSQITVSGSGLTVALTNALARGKTYAVLIDGGAIEGGTGASYAGISSTSVWSFTTSLGIPYTTNTVVTVPDGIAAVTIKAWGAGGGGGSGGDSNVGGIGGAGGFVEGTFPVMPGHSLSILVGGGGGGGASASAYSGDGGGGGGYSAVSNQTSDVLLALAAGGGGGGAGDNTGGHPGGAGGAGGGTNGAAGPTVDYPGGGGGLQAVGGAGAGNGTAGTAFTGGEGQNGKSTVTTVTGGANNGGANGGGDGGLAESNYAYPGGGGGGAGYFGGGGGAASAASSTGASGGGGGAAFLDASGTVTTNVAGVGSAPPDTSDSDYDGSGGVGGEAGSTGRGPGIEGSAGLVVITWIPADGALLSSLSVTSDLRQISVAADYRASFVASQSDATDITFDFAALGTGAGSMDLSPCSTTIGDYGFSGFDASPTGVTVNPSAKTIAFTGGTVSGGAHTISNAVSGTGWRMVNADIAETYSVTVSVAAASSTVDLTLLPAPVLVSKTPTNNAVDVLPNLALTASFDSPIVLLDAAGVTLTNLTQSSDTAISVSVSSSTNLVITPDALLNAGETYAVLMVSNAVAAYSGIADTNTWRFTTVAAAGSAPVVDTLSPADQATAVAIDSTLAITFDQTVLKGSGSIELWQDGGSSAEQTIDVTTGSVTLNDATATIALSADLSPATDYYVIVPAGAFTDVTTTYSFAGLLNVTDWTFQTEVLEAPTVTVAGGATGIAAGVATLNGAVTDDGGVGFEGVTLYFGTADGGTNDVSSWDTNFVFETGSVTLGDTFATNVTGLYYGQRYTYRVFASNAYGHAWSAATNFTTAIPTGWTPAELNSSVLTLWLDAADAATIGLDGTTVTNWLDKSGNGNHGIGTNAVSYIASDSLMNNMPSIGNSSTSGDNGIKLPVISAKHVYVVTYYDDGTATTFPSYRTLFGGTGSSDAYKVMSGTGVSDWLVSSFFPDSGTFRDGAATAALTALPMPAALWKFKSSAVRTQDRQLGYYRGSARDWTGRYSEWIFTDGTEAPDTEKTIEGYLAWKWGCQSKLPGEHPYAAAAPGGALNLDDVVIATGATNVATEAADLQGTLNTPLSVFTVTAYWSTNSNTTAQAWIDDATKSSEFLGTYTNINGQALLVELTGLSSLTSYTYTFHATNAVTNIWAGSVTFSTKTNATVTLTAGDLAKVYDGAAKTVGTVTDPVGLNVVTTYAGSTATPTNAGTYEVVATIEELLYEGASTGTLVVAQADPGVTSWPTATSIGLGQALSNSTLVSGAATVGGEFGFAELADEPPAGTNNVWVLYTAVDANNYFVASNLVEVIVSDTSASVALGSLSQVYDASAKEASYTTDPAGLNVVLSYDGNTAAPTNAGSYAVEAIINDGAYVGSTNGTLVVSKATPSIDSWPTAASMGSGQSLTASSLSGGTVTIGAMPVTGTFSFVNPSFVPPAVGTYEVDVTFTPDDTGNVLGVSGTVNVTVSSLIYSESFEYGASGVLFNTATLGGWSANSGVIKYDPNVNFDHSLLGNEAAGSMWLDYSVNTSYARTAYDSSLDFAMTGLASGEALWLVAVIEFVDGGWLVSGDSDAFLLAEQGSGTTYSDIGFRMLADGSVEVRCSDNGGATAYHSTGQTVGNSTNLIVMRAQKGSPAATPANSRVDFWLNPAGTSRLSLLGAPTWTTGADSGFGRDGDTFTQLAARPTHSGGRIDEIRIGKSYWGIIPTEKPGTIFSFR